MHATDANRSDTSAASVERFRTAIEFALRGDLRFLSHHDEVRLLARALRRAQWPVAYSQGFNPQPRMALPLPRSVGVASESEWCVVELSAADGLRSLFDRLAATLPQACALRSVSGPIPRGRPHPRSVRYRVRIEAAHRAGLAERIEALHRATSIALDRTYGDQKPPRRIEIRPLIESLRLETDVLNMSLTFIEQVTARPTEVLAALDLPTEHYAHRLCRIEVEWDLSLTGLDRWPPVSERNDSGQEESSIE